MRVLELDPLHLTDDLMADVAENVSNTLEVFKAVRNVWMIAGRLQLKINVTPDGITPFESKYCFTPVTTLQSVNNFKYSSSVMRVEGLFILTIGLQHSANFLSYVLLH